MDNPALILTALHRRLPGGAVFSGQTAGWLHGLDMPPADPRHQGRFLARTDLYYPDHRLTLEYDGGTHRESLVEDNRRQNRLLRAGFRLLRFTASEKSTLRKAALTPGYFAPTAWLYWSIWG